MEFKFVVFLGFILLVVPITIFLTKVYKNLIHVVFVVMVTSLCESEKLEIMFISRPFYRSVTRGIGISVADCCALVIFCAMLLRRSDYKLRWLPPLSIQYIFYCLVITISWLFVSSDQLVPEFYYQFGTWPNLTTEYFEITLYPLFELSKVMRGMFIFWVVVNYLSVKENFRYLFIAILLLTSYVCLIAFYQRYVLKYYRVFSTIIHPNGLATYMVMCLSLIAGWAIYFKNLQRKSICVLISYICCVTLIMTLSRGGLAIAFGCSLLLLYYIYRKNLTLLNLVFLTMTFVFGVLVVMKSYGTLSERFSVSVSSDYEYREDHNVQAIMMGEDNFWGVGMGNFSALSWLKYYEMGASGKQDFPGTPAHNLWYLTFAELGWPGLFALFCVWFKFALLVRETGRFNLKSDEFNWLVVCAVALLGMHLQELLNNGFRLTSIYYLVQIISAAAVAVYCNNRALNKQEEMTL